MGTVAKTGGPLSTQLMEPPWSGVSGQQALPSGRSHLSPKHKSLLFGELREWTQTILSSRVINVICLISRVVLFQSLKGCGGGKGALLLTLKSRMKGLSVKTKPKEETQLGSSFLRQKRTNGSIYGTFTCFWSEGVFVITVANNITLVYIYLCTSCLFFKRT